MWKYQLEQDTCLLSEELSPAGTYYYFFNELLFFLLDFQRGVGNSSLEF